MNFWVEKQKFVQGKGRLGNGAQAKNLACRKTPGMEYRHNDYGKEEGEE